MSTYIGTYKVIKIYRKSNRREIIERDLSLEEAKKLTNSFPDRSGSMVVFCKQFSSKKYFI